MPGRSATFCTRPAPRVLVGPAAWLLLGQAGPGAQRSVQEIYWWLGAIVIAALALAIVGLIVRRLVMGPKEDKGDEGFMLSDLRRLHREGNLSDEEYRSARTTMIAQGRALLDKEEPDQVGSGPEANDQPPSGSDAGPEDGGTGDSDNSGGTEPPPAAA